MEEPLDMSVDPLYEQVTERAYSKTKWDIRKDLFRWGVIGFAMQPVGDVYETWIDYVYHCKENRGCS